MAKVGPAEAALAPARAKEEGTGQTCVKVCSWDQRAGTSELGTTRSQGSCAASAMTTARPCLQALWAKASRIFLRQGLNKNAATYPGHELRVRLNVGRGKRRSTSNLKVRPREIATLETFHKTNALSYVLLRDRSKIPSSIHICKKLGLPNFWTAL